MGSTREYADGEIVYSSNENTLKKRVNELFHNEISDTFDYHTYLGQITSDEYHKLESAWEYREQDLTGRLAELLKKTRYCNTTGDACAFVIKDDIRITNIETLAHLKTEKIDFKDNKYEVRGCTYGANGRYRLLSDAKAKVNQHKETCKNAAIYKTPVKYNLIPKTKPTKVKNATVQFFGWVRI